MPLDIDPTQRFDTAERVVALVQASGFQTALECRYGSSLVELLATAGLDLRSTSRHPGSAWAPQHHHQIPVK